MFFKVSLAEWQIIKLDSSQKGKIKPNCDFRNTEDLSIKSSTSAQDCANECLIYIECNAFSHQNGKCHLKKLNEIIEENLAPEGSSCGYLPVRMLANGGAAQTILKTTSVTAIFILLLNV